MRAKLPTKQLKSYAVRMKFFEHETIIIASSPGKAKSEFIHRLDIDGYTFKDARVRYLGAPAHVTTPEIERNANYRGVPFVKAGMRVCVGQACGQIIGVNSSANWDVLFDADSEYGECVLNCHPNNEIAYFDESGQLIQDFRTMQPA